MGLLGGFRPFNADVDPEEERKRKLAELLSSRGPGTGQDFESNFDDTNTMPSSADNVQSKFDAPDIEPPSPRGETLDVFADWARRMPRRDDPMYKPSTKRKILGGIVGGLAAFGHGPNSAGVADRIIHSKYRNALEDWTREGKALGEVAPVLARDRASDVAQFGHRVTQRGQDVSRQTAQDRIAQDQTEETGRDTRQGALLTSEEKRATQADTTRRRGQDVTKRGQDLSSTAAANRTAAVNTRTSEMAKNRTKKVEIPIPVKEQRMAEEDALMDIQREHPEWSHFIDQGDMRTPASIKAFEERPHWYSSSKNNPEDYKKLLVEFEKKKKEKLDMRRTGASTSYGDVEPVTDNWDEE